MVTVVGVTDEGQFDVTPVGIKVRSSFDRIIAAPGDRRNSR
jgi:hypothetical protein